jgi:hypothetical protein
LDEFSTLEAVLKKGINGMYSLLCFALLVLLVATAKIHFEEHALVAGTKQISQADKAVKQTRQAGWHGCQACLLCFGPACVCY